MALYKTEAVVLREYDLGEQDKIVVFYSRRYGKIRVVAKGARRIKSRFAPAIQFPSCDELIVHKTREDKLDILSECKIKYSFIKIRSSLVRFAYSSYLAELIARFVEDEEPCPILFYLFLRGLFLLEKASPGQNLNPLIRSFELKLLDVVGYRPCLERCVNCGKEVRFIKSIYFAVESGGILCEDCRARNGRGLTISRQMVNLVHHLLSLKLEEAYRLKINGGMEEDLEVLLKAFLSYRAGVEMLTPPFIRNFKKLESEKSIEGESGKKHRD